MYILFTTCFIQHTKLMIRKIHLKFNAELLKVFMSSEDSNYNGSYS